MSLFSHLSHGRKLYFEMARRSPSLNDYLLRIYKNDDWAWGLDWDENWGEVHRKIYNPTLAHPADDLIVCFQYNHPPYRALADHLFWRNDILLDGEPAELETPDLRQILTLRRVCRTITAHVDETIKIWLDVRTLLFDLLEIVQRKWKNGRAVSNPLLVMHRMRIMAGAAIERRRTAEAQISKRPRLSEK